MTLAPYRLPRTLALSLAVAAGLTALSGATAQRPPEAASPPATLAATPSAASTAPVAKAPVPVLVELFTSEGCSSCPPADALLAQLDRRQPVPGAQIIVLGEHVDYWDGQGWRDRFSSDSFTRRQRDYQFALHGSDIYTPQLIVNGHQQLLGSDAAHIVAAIQQATSDPVAALQIAAVQLQGKTVSFALAPGAPLPAGFDLYAAVVQPEATTEVRGGENGGRTLHHAGVVRAFTRVATGVQTTGLARTQFKLDSIAGQAPGSDLAGLRLVVFAQTRHTGPILGVAACVFASSSSPAAPSGSANLLNRCPPPGI